jgi:Trypsin-like peptidase domain/Effector-associated domain 1
LDLEQLNGPQSKILRQVILSAFVDETSADMFLASELEKQPLAVIAGGANFEQRIFNLIRVSQAEGWTGDLIAALQADRPRNVLVRNLPDALRLAVTDAPPRPSSSGQNLEKIVSNGGFADLRIWAEKMVAIGQALCRIEFPTAHGTGYGTGFLVSSDFVLTNYHVIENHIQAKLDPATISCRFDYARDTKGLDEGRLVGLAAGSSWIVAHSPYDPADISGVGSATAGHLDFALLRLSEAAAEQDVGGGGRRGTVAVRRQAPVPADKAPVFIVQHPKGTPMALSIGIVQGVSGNGARIRYDADTLNGSSGSCVFDQRLDLVALHHSGDPSASLRAQYNEGIPMRGIVAMLEAKGVSPFWQ